MLQIYLTMNFVSVSGIVTDNYILSCANDFYKKNLEHQKLFREFKTPVNDGIESYKHYQVKLVCLLMVLKF